MAEAKGLITLKYLERALTKAKEAAAQDTSDLKDRVQALEDADSEHNKIEVIKVNDSVQSITPADRSVNIKVPTKVSEIANDSKFQSADDVNKAIASHIGSAYKAGGSVEATKFGTAPGADEEGKVYNANGGFSTNENFVDASGKTYPAGTNVAVVKVEEEYKYDVLSGFVDLSGYAETGDIPKITASETNGSIKVDSSDIKVYDIEKDTATEAEFSAMLESVFPAE